MPYTGTVSSAYAFGDTPDKEQNFGSFMAVLKDTVNTVSINTATQLSDADNYEIYNDTDFGGLVLRYTVTIDDSMGGTKTVTSVVKPRETENVGFGKDVIKNLVFDSIGDDATLQAALIAEVDGVLDSANFAALAQFDFTGLPDTLSFRIKAVNG